MNDQQIKVLKASGEYEPFSEEKVKSSLKRAGAKKELIDKIVSHRQKFHQPWLVTNTKVTSEVKTYAQCVGLQVISWDYPADFNLRFLIEKRGLHPVTCLNSLNQSEKGKLLENGIVFCRDLIQKKIDFLPAVSVNKAKKEALGICGNK